MYGGLWPYQPVGMVPGYPWATADPLWPARFPGRGPLPADLALQNCTEAAKRLGGFSAMPRSKIIFFSNRPRTLMGILDPHQCPGFWGPEVAMSMVENGKTPGRKNRVSTAEETAVRRNGIPTCNLDL